MKRTTQNLPFQMRYMMTTADFGCGGRKVSEPYATAISSASHSHPTTTSRARKHAAVSKAMKKALLNLNVKRSKMNASSLTSPWALSSPDPLRSVVMASGKGPWTAGADSTILELGCPAGTLIVRAYSDRSGNPDVRSLYRRGGGGGWTRMLQSLGLDCWRMLVHRRSEGEDARV